MKIIKSWTAPYSSVLYNRESYWSFSHRIMIQDKTLIKTLNLVTEMISKSTVKKNSSIIRVEDPTTVHPRCNLGACTVLQNFYLP